MCRYTCPRLPASRRDIQEDSLHASTELSSSVTEPYGSHAQTRANHVALRSISWRKMADFYNTLLNH